VGALTAWGAARARLEIVPKRVDTLAVRHRGWLTSSPGVIAEVSVDAPVIRPAFAAGDAAVRRLFVPRRWP
jgi:hypothetical protein